MRVAVVHNTTVSDLGQVGAALAEAGASLSEYRPFSDRRLPDPQSFDGLVVLGGEQSAVNDKHHPCLPALAALMRRAAEDGRAVLGICLGSQILARAFGGENHIGQSREFGWTPISLTAEGRDDPVLAAAGQEFLSFQWHSDSFTLPPGARHLAAGRAVLPQAFRMGRAAYGTQFHFEANQTVVANWTRNFPDATEAMRPGWLARHARESAAHGAVADAAGIAIARAWVGQIGG